MQNKQIKPYLSPEVMGRLNAMAEHYSMSGPQLASLILTEMSRVRKESLFHALSSIPEDLKTRPVGRPAGSKTKRDEHGGPESAAA